MTAASDTQIPYATPSRKPAPRGIAGIAIIFGGLGLVALGGCFLIGVLIINIQANARVSAGSPYHLTTSEILLMSSLYFMAFASIVGAAIVLFAGIRSLLRVLST